MSEEHSNERDGWHIAAQVSFVVTVIAMAVVVCFGGTARVCAGADATMMDACSRACGSAGVVKVAPGITSNCSCRNGVR